MRVYAPCWFWWFHFSVVSHVFCAFNSFCNCRIISFSSPPYFFLKTLWLFNVLSLLRVTQELLTRALATENAHDMLCGTADQSLGNSPNSCSTCTPSSPHMTSALPQNDITMGKIIISFHSPPSSVRVHWLLGLLEGNVVLKVAVHVHICTCMSLPWQCESLVCTMKAYMFRLMEFLPLKWNYQQV